jgi:hypothetical protein
MSVLLELISPALIAVFLEFIFYITGAAIFRIATFGQKNVPFFSLGEFRAEKSRSNNNSTYVSLLGLVFYATVISAIVILG